MRRGPLLNPAALILGTALALPAAAQRESYSFVSYAGPDVALLSTASDEEAARLNTPVLSGDRIVTGSGSRAEVVLASGNVVRIDLKTELRFDRMSRTYESDDDRDLLVLFRGAVAAEIRAPEAGERAFRLDTDDATVVVEGRGLVRVDASRRGTEIWVLAGEAEVAGRGGQVVVGAGQYAFVLGDGEIEAENYDPPRDRFTRFVDERRDRHPQGGGAQWVSSEYDYESSLADFDDNGSWVYASSAGGWCWRPSVAADWRPYTYGSWRWTPAGLTWVSYEPWGWLPYHYGTWWWENPHGWVWSPGAAYAPAWVYWSYTPSYVGWCPMGYYGRGVRIPHHRVSAVEVSQVDPRGWNYAPLPRIGRHLDPARDILRSDRLSFRPADTAVISTSPLRIDRGTSSAQAAVREALRKISQPVPAGAVSTNAGLTAFLRRDPALTPAAERDLRRVLVPARRDEALRPVTPDTLVSGAVAVSRDANLPVSRVDDWRAPAAPVSGGPVLRGGPSRRRESAGDNGWRSPTSPAPRDLSPRPTETADPGDTGWRA
ncbi:MAG TPA: FecR family protein, partial [Thermoanaerobaculia bacterium]|nr:FecR family protein [Thermoanaerobaculia bacterium]